MKGQRGRRRALKRRYGGAKRAGGHGAVKVENLRIVAMVDQDPDLSYLTGGGDPDYADQDRERHESYGDKWHMIGIRAEADAIIHGTSQRVTSGGLWGIESDSGKEHFREVAKDEYDALVQILRTMGAKKIPSFASAEWVDA